MAKQSINNSSNSDVLSDFAIWVKEKRSSVANIRIYESTLNDLKIVAGNRTIRYKDLNDPFVHSLYEFWMSKNPPLQNASIAKKINCIKAFLKVYNPDQYTSFKHLTPKLNIIRYRPIVIPTMGEFDKIVHAEKFIPQGAWSSSVELARDLFVIGATTGMSLSTILLLKDAKIKKFNIRSTFLELPSGSKDISEIKIPLIPLSKLFISRLFKKYLAHNKRIFISPDKINSNLHELFRHLQIDDTISIPRYTGSQRVIHTYPKYELMSMRTSRKFFISTCVNENVMNYHSIIGFLETKTYNNFRKSYIVDSLPVPSQPLEIAFSSIEVPKQ